MIKILWPCKCNQPVIKGWNYCPNCGLKLNWNLLEEKINSLDNFVLTEKI